MARLFARARLSPLRVATGGDASLGSKAVPTAVASPVQIDGAVACCGSRSLAHASSSGVGVARRRISFEVAGQSG